MFVGHNLYMVALSVAIAILGGYTGFGLAARVRNTSGAGRRWSLAGAAVFLAVSIWTMHFVGILAAPLPAGAAYLVLPTVVSFLICALVVGVSLFFASIGESSDVRIAASALLLGAGIVSMHYVGIYGLAGPFRIEHQHEMMVLATLIAVVTAYGGLRIFLARHGGMRLALSATAFGIAVSGMHYTAMYGTRFLPTADRDVDGLVASPQALSLVVSLLCFFIVAGFLLFLVPEPGAHVSAAVAAGESGDDLEERGADGAERGGPQSATLQAQRHLPLQGLGQPRVAPMTRLPLEGADGTHFVEAGQIRSIKAAAHYTLVHDGSRERMCPWPISQAEAQLDPAFFLRVHRSHIVAITHVTLIRKEGDGAVVELDGPVPHLVPVSRARIAELKARLGLTGQTQRQGARHPDRA